MHLRRSLSLRAPHFTAAGLVAALGLVAPQALAQRTLPPDSRPAEAPPAVGVAGAQDAEPIRFTFDLHGGLYYRVGNTAVDPSARGGGLVGFDALIGTNKWWQAGVGYDHAFLGSERKDDVRTGAFLDTNRALDELWFLGRVYPYQNENIGLYVQLGLGPAWQEVSNSGTSASTTAGGSLVLTPSSCTAHATPGLGLRGGAGVDVVLSNLIIFFGEVGVDHFRLAGSQLGGCGNGIGPSTFLATRFGFALATGRSKPPPPAAPPAPPSDRDGDAILDDVDACPDQAGLANPDPTKNGCPPPPDRDHDGIPDAADACPDAAGPPSDDPKKNGCPDKDGDKIIDSLDACPDIPGVANEDPKENGCPPDTDGDGIRDDKDACPTEKGLPNADPSKNGCPLVAVREQEIVITQAVQFDVDKATIKKESDELLDGIAKVMKDHPELTKIEVQGHTDTQGTKQHNKVLSQARAESVKRALEKRGVAAARLSAVGYGQEKPIADNGTEEGMAKNRRVQFFITAKSVIVETETKQGVAPKAPPPPKAPPAPKKP
jgi:outer membrane protein OmpA-like peptidoglycan-associated protein